MSYQTLPIWGRFVCFQSLQPSCAEQCSLTEQSLLTDQHAPVTVGRVTQGPGNRRPNRMARNLIYIL